MAADARDSILKTNTTAAASASGNGSATPAAIAEAPASSGSGNRAPSENVMRSAGIVSIAVAMSRVTGLLRESLMARLFGAGLAYDAFMLGFRIPNLTRDLFAEGALSSAFVPVFTEYLNQRSKEEAARLAQLVATAIFLVVGAVCALGVIFAPSLVHLLAPGYAAVPGKFELAVTMTRIMFPFLLLVALAAQAMGVLNASNKFGVPAMAALSADDLRRWQWPAGTTRVTIFADAGHAGMQAAADRETSYQLFKKYVEPGVTAAARAMQSVQQPGFGRIGKGDLIVF